jgi:hypothetical protein
MDKCDVSQSPASSDLEKGSTRQTTLFWNNLGFSVLGKDEPIIQGISGRLVSGEILAVSFL